MFEIRVAVRFLAKNKLNRTLGFDERPSLDTRVTDIVASQVDFQSLCGFPSEGERILVDLVDAVQGEINRLEIGQVVESIAAHLTNALFATVGYVD